MGIPLGLVLGAAQTFMQTGINRQQKERQEDLMGLQQQKEMDMWRNTNYSAQKEQIIKAGLNPGLIYGMGGGGGTTTGSGSVPTPVEQKNPLGMIDAAQLALLKAQRDNIEADTRNKEAGAIYTEGAQTQKTRAEADYTSGVQTEKTDAEAKLTGQKLSTEIAETGIKRIELDIANKTSNEQVATIRQAARKIEGEAQSALAQGTVDEKTVQTQINQRKADLLATAIHNKLMESQKGLTDQQAWATAESVAQKWKQLATDRINAINSGTAVDANWENMQINKFTHDVSESTKLNYEWAGDVIKGVGVPLGLSQMKITPKYNEVKGFSNQHK